MKGVISRNDFKERVHDWSRKLNVEVAWLGIRPMRRKWASRSTKEHLNFNSELLYKDRKFQDHVIVHELLHLRVPNHGKLFKSLLRAIWGDWESCVCDASTEQRSKNRLSKVDDQ